MGRPWWKPGERPIGRAKGTPNKRTAAVRTVYQLAFQKIGGVDRLVEWIKESPQNEYAFHTAIYPRLLPVRVEGHGPHGEIEVNVKVSHEELPKELLQRGLPPAVFGFDKPVLDLKAEPVKKANGKGDEDYE